ncbi:MAG: ornithine carbamoyltransferase [Balneolaceae bacterium]|nr:MAG: ornithine carbamoyltransferase [Balneolaceae bacterium]
MKDFLTIGELEPEEIESILERSLKLHQSPQPLLSGKNIGFVFEKPSLRTKIGTEVAINRLGGDVVHIESDLLFANGKAVPFTSRESLQDAMMNVSQWCDALFARVYSHTSLEKMSQYGTIPVINALCNLHHPMQALADLLTIQQKFPGKDDLTITFVGDANNVAFSLTEIGLKMGYQMKFSGPENYSWSQDNLSYFSLLAVEHGGSFTATSDPFQAVKGSDVIYTDTFISMGEEHLYEDKIMHFEPYQVNEKLFSATGKNHTGFMHCLPAHRGIEVTDAVIDHPESWIYQQAKNRMIVSLGVFAAIFTRNGTHHP